MGDDGQTSGEKKIEEDLNAVDANPKEVGGDPPSAPSTEPTTPTTAPPPSDGGDTDPARDKFEKLHGDEGY